MLILVLLMLLFPVSAFANPACAVCTVAMGAFLGISKRLGISDSVSGVWIGALVLMTYYFSVKFFEYKKWTFKFYKVLLGVLTLSVVPVMYEFVPYGVVYYLGIDSFLLSMIMGAFAFWLSQVIYQKMKDNNGGHAHFPFEKVVMAVVFLILVSLLFYFIA